MIAVAARLGPQIRDIRTAAALGDRARRNLPARQNFRYHTRSDRGPRGARDRRRADGVAHQAGTDAAGAGTRQLLRGHDLHELVGRNAAALLGKAKREKANVRSLGIELAREFAGLVPFAGIGLNLARHEAAHDVAEGFVFGIVERTLHPRVLQHGPLLAVTMPRSTCRKLASSRWRRALHGSDATHAIWSDGSIRRPSTVKHLIVSGGEPGAGSRYS